MEELCIRARLNPWKCPLKTWQKYNIETTILGKKSPQHILMKGSIQYFIIIAAVLWTGSLVKWIAFLSRNAINIRTWTDCKLYYFLFFFGRHYSSMLLVLMSVEKCFVIYFPLKSRTVCTVKTAKYATGFVGVVLAGYDIQYLIVCEATVDKNNCVCGMTHVDMSVDSVLYSFLPFILMFLTNFAIVFKFIGAKCTSNQSNSTESTNQALVKSATRGTAMVVTVSATFLLLTAPTALSGALHSWYWLDSLPLYRMLTNFMQYLNHSINGILYCVVGSKFRAELFNILCRKKNLPGTSGSDSVNCTSHTNVSEVGTRLN